MDNSFLENIGFNSPTGKPMSGPVPNSEVNDQINRLFVVSRNQQELLASLLQASKIILKYPELSVSGALLFDKCRSMTHATCGFITIREANESGNDLIVVELGPENLKVSRNFPRMFEESRQKVFEGKCSVLENDLARLPLGIVNMLLVPVIYDQIVVGILALGNKPDDFHEEDVAIAEAFAELIALAWFNNRNLEDLKVARIRAEESDRLKSAFLSNMSHEIRTPLNGILGFSELLCDADLSLDEREQYIRIINQNGDQLMSIINNILDISLIESGQIVLYREWVDIQELIREVYELFLAPGLRKETVLYQLDCGQGIRTRLYTDFGRLRQILVNLFGNATKFTKYGQIIIGCKIIGQEQNREIEISVEDTGIGIQPEKLDVIFERFGQAETDTKRNFGGTGLGLAISKGLTELLGGRMEVQSEPMVGSTFRVIFPLREK